MQANIDGSASPEHAAQDTVLHQSERTLVFRRRLKDGSSIICKQPLRTNAPERLCHEKQIIERLAGIEGVSRIARGPYPSTAIALEDCDGVSLARMSRTERFELPALLTLMSQLSHIVAAMHRAGVTHKDINPANILLSGARRLPVIIDFCLARTASGPRQDTNDHGEIAGTLAYVAPEQTGRTGRTVDQRADLYALGATFYELATGRPPFIRDDPLQLIHDHLVRVPVPPVELDPRLPPALSEIILRLLEKEPERRYQSASGLAHDLGLLREQLATGETGVFRLGEHDFAARLEPSARLIGRESELNTLRSAFTDSLLGACNGALVAGGPGVGKSTLINALRPLVAAHHGWFVTGKSDQYRQDASSSGLNQAFRALGRLLLAEPEAELSPLRARLRLALGPNAGLLVSTLPEFALLLGVEPEVIADDPGTAGRRLVRAGLDVLRSVASKARPLVMVLDDLQWAGPTQMAVVDAVLTDAPCPGLLLVGAYRPAELDVAHPLTAPRDRWRRLGTAPPLLALANLEAAGLASLLADMLRLSGDKVADLADAVATRTGGNPFDTVELVNALRDDGLLVHGEAGWSWDAAAIRRHVGSGEVIDLLNVRLRRLPLRTRHLLNLVACLGGEVEPRLLCAAAGVSAEALTQRLAPALDAGLALVDQGGGGAVRFRHARVQQAAHGRLTPASWRRLHLALARRLTASFEFVGLAAEQYLPAIAAVRDPEECRLVASLFHHTATALRVINPTLTERLLTAAAGLLETPGAAAADDPLWALVQTDRHGALASLGRLDEADAIYRWIEASGMDALSLVAPACVQITSMTNRDRPREALALGLGLLGQLGFAMPRIEIAEQISRCMVLTEAMAEHARRDDHQRELASAPPVIGAARLIDRLMSTAAICDPAAFAWLVTEAMRLWIAHGPCAELVCPVARSGNIISAVAGGYVRGYETVRHVVAISEARGFDHSIPKALFLLGIYASHWVEPLEDGVRGLQRAREGLLHEGDLQNAAFTDTASILILQDCAPTLEILAKEIDAAIAFATSTGNSLAVSIYEDYRRLTRILRAEPTAGDPIDEATAARPLAGNSVSSTIDHTTRALIAALFGDTDALANHVARAMTTAENLRNFYFFAQARLLRALALAEQVRATPGGEAAALLTELDLCRAWLAQRAADAPANFRHLWQWIEAERAWAVNDFQTAARTFDTALREVEAHRRPWHRALMTERAGMFHLTHGMERTGSMLMTQARYLYKAWGASAKVRQLEQTYSFLAILPDAGRDQQLRPGGSRNGDFSVDTIDTLAILRASQALSSETSMVRLRSKVVELLRAITGATTVRLALWHEDANDWFLSVSADVDAAPVCVEEAGVRGLLPLSAFHYARRTLEPLLVEDATRDDRFARDPYVAGLRHCSLLVVPILNQGAARAMLLLENQLSRGAFSIDRLDAVMLIAGQLSVSLQNALLYEELEQRVFERTSELHKVQGELVTAARKAGMAEIAANVLHNVGNVLNSVNISAGLLTAQLSRSKLKGLGRAVRLMDDHADALGEFLTRDAKGRLLPTYLRELALTLGAEHETMAAELHAICKNVDHIQKVVAAQQSYAGAPRVVESQKPGELVGDALRMNAGVQTQPGVTVMPDVAKLPALMLDRHRLLQILVNLISNAKHATTGIAGRCPRVTLGAVIVDEQVLRITVADNGEGIAPENLTRIFTHGFTTRAAGNGFGLHSCVLAAREMGGGLTAHSDGPGLGSTFTLEVPTALAERQR